MELKKQSLMQELINVLLVMEQKLNQVLKKCHALHVKVKVSLLNNTDIQSFNPCVEHVVERGPRLLLA